MAKQAISVFWFRRDLRLEDNAGLYHALTGEYPVLPIFIFDSNILDDLEDRSDKRVSFIHDRVARIKQELKALGSDLLVLHGRPIDMWKKLLKDFDIKTAFTNRDYEPYAKQRDQGIYEMLHKAGIPFKGYKDQVIFDKAEVMKKDAKPYTVFTPYSRRWKAQLTGDSFKAYPSSQHLDRLTEVRVGKMPSLQELNFRKSDFNYPSDKLDIDIVKTYDQTRDYPALDGTTKMGLHLRFGTVSIRALARQAQANNETYLNELIWRDFYHMILYHFPQVATQAFKAKYEAIPWRNNKEEFEAWCEGRTGYPLVDAGMRELNATGYMHNRVRMVVASFLTKHLLIDWRWGEAYFAGKLLDFDLAANNGGWQWASSTGCDAAPYFRIFNPTSQYQKFDKELHYITKWVPEFGTPVYPAPIVDHKMARQRAIDTYKQALQAAKQDVSE